jgi:hypothetical protein
MRYIPQTPQEVESFAARATEMTAAATPQAPVVPIPEQPDIYKCLGAANDQSKRRNGKSKGINTGTSSPK